MSFFINKSLFILIFHCQGNLKYFIIEFLLTTIFYLQGEKEMKLKLFFIVLLALLASGCAESIVAVPKAVLTGTGNVITSVVDAIIFWD